MASITIEVPEEVAERLRKEAELSGRNVAEVAQAWVVGPIEQQKEEALAIAKARLARGGKMLSLEQVHDNLQRRIAEWKATGSVSR